MKIVIKSKNPILTETRSRYSEIVTQRYRYLYHNKKINNWKKFIEYIKKYKEEK